MIKRRLMRMTLAVAVLLASSLTASAAAGTADAPRITKEQAKALLGTPGVLFVDARTESAWNGSDRKINGAVRIDKWDLGMWSSGFPDDMTFIVY